MISGIIGGLVVGLIGGSPLQVSGPAVGLVVLVFELHQEHGMGALGLIVMMAGLLQIAAGLLKTGPWFRAISPAVVYGMLAGIGVLIMSSQFHVVVDDAPKGSGISNLISIPQAVFNGIFPIDGSPHETAALIGLLTIGVMVGWNKLRPESLKFLPGPILGLAAAAAMSFFYTLEIKHVNIPDNLLAGLGVPALQSLSGLLELKYWAEAAALAFIASAETLLSVAAVDKLTAATGRPGLRSNYDRELMAQGVGNLCCGSLGALPLTGLIVRTGANVRAGAQTRWSSVMQGGWLVLTVLLIPHVLERIPTSALAAVLVVTGWKLVNPEHVKKLRAYGWIPVFIYGSTLIGVVAFDLLTGVLIGITLTIAKVLLKASRLGVKLVTHHSGRSDLYLEGSATFLRLPALAHALDKVGPKVQLHIHFEKLAYLDHSCLDLIREWRMAHEENGGQVVVEWDRLVQRFTSTKA